MAAFRITGIALDHDGRRYEEGEVVEAGDQVPFEVLEARLAAGTAELVGEGEAELSAEFVQALDAWRAGCHAQFDALILVVDLALQDGPAACRAFVTTMAEFSGRAGEGQPRLLQVIALSETYEPFLNTEALLPVPEKLESTADAHDEPASETVLPGSEGAVEEHHADLADLNPAAGAALTDNPAANGGGADDAAGGSSSAADPSPPPPPTSPAPAKSAGRGKAKGPKAST
jgi:hypothetical protein